MKTLLCVGLFAVIAGVWNAAAQGTVNFANGAAGVNAPVQPILNGAPVEGADWRAELLIVKADGSSKLIGQPATFEYAELAGYFFGGSVIVPRVEPGTTATFQIRVSDALGTVERFSNPVTVTLGGVKTPPPNLIGLENWASKALTMLPQLAISIAQQTVSRSWSKDLLNAILEFTESLAKPNWVSATEAPQTTGEKLTLTFNMPSFQRYYRLRLP